MVVVCCAVLGTIIYRVSLVTVFHRGAGDFLRKHVKIFTSITAAVINLVIILILTRVRNRSYQLSFFIRVGLTFSLN